MDRRLGVPQRLYGRCDDKGVSLPQSEIESRFVSHAARNLVAIQIPRRY